MALRTKGPLAGFSWLAGGINLGRRNAKAVFGGAALLLVLAFLPSLLTVPLQLGTQAAGAATPTNLLLVFGISLAAGLLLMPAYVGYMRVIDAAERGRPTRARDVFAPYRQGAMWRLVGYGAAMFAVYAAVLGGILATVGRGLGSWYLDVLATAGSHAPPPPLPSGVGLAILLLIVAALWLTGVYAISLGQVALRDRGVGSAITDGLVGGLKNLLPLVALMLGLVFAWIVLALVVGLAAVLVMLLGKLVGMWLVVVVAIPLYVALVLAMIVVLFGAMYHLWRDVCDDGDAPGMAQAIAA